MTLLSKHRVAAPFVLLASLLAFSVLVGDVVGGRWAPVVVIALAALKVAVVVSEYVEVRGSARWLVGAWLAWGSAVFGGLALLTVG